MGDAAAGDRVMAKGFQKGDPRAQVAGSKGGSTVRKGSVLQTPEYRRGYRAGWIAAWRRIIARKLQERQDVTRIISGDTGE